MTNTSDLMVMIVLCHKGLFLVSFVSTQELLAARWLDSLIKHWPRSIFGFDERSYECWFRQLFCRRYKKLLCSFCESGCLECGDVAGREFYCWVFLYGWCHLSSNTAWMLTLFPFTESHLFESIEISWMTDDWLPTSEKFKHFCIKCYKTCFQAITLTSIGIFTSCVKY